MAEGGFRQNRVYKAMNRPLTVLGAERRLFFAALITGGAVFSLMHSLVGGIGLFVVGVSRARRYATFALCFPAIRNAPSSMNRLSVTGCACSRKSRA